MAEPTSIGRASKWGVDVDGPWVVACNLHGTMVGARSLLDADGLAEHPEQFCDECRRAKNVS